MKFKRKLAHNLAPEWKDRYIAYKDLDDKIKILVHLNRNEIHVLKDSFSEDLDHAVETIVLFFIMKQGEIATRIEKVYTELKEIIQDDSITKVIVKNALLDLRSCGEDLLKLIDYVYLNSEGLRKILKKFDKHVKTNLSREYVMNRVKDSANHVAQLSHQPGLSALILTLTNAMELCYRSLHTLSSVRGSLEEKIEIYESEPILNDIFLSRIRASKATSFYDSLASQAGIFEDEEEQLDIIDNLRRSRTDTICIFLNALSTLLYMVNYYVVAPSSGDYAEYLGANEVMTGIVIGMAPLSGLFSSMVYSWWSNVSFKAPLIFCSSCCFTGNLFYSLAHRYDSFMLVIIGRLLTGFGGARAINRRYIADNVPRHDRLKRSAEFVAASALGMAVGPALSSALDFMPGDEFLNHFITWNNMTSPGWVMMLIWAIYLMLLFIIFEDPPRKTETLYSKAKPRFIFQEEEEFILEPSVDPREIDRLIPKPKQNKKSLLQTLWTNHAIAHCLFVYFVIKYAGELLVSSSSIVTRYYFAWPPSYSGWFLAFLGLMMFPLNILLGYLSSQYNDRSIMWPSLVAMALGCAIMVPLGGEYPVTQYALGGIVVFLSTNAVESVLMSILSKLMPKHLAKGTFNSGLLSTECGMSGRMVGDFAVTLCGLQGMSNLLPLAFGPAFVVSFICIGVSFALYEKLVD